MPKGGEIVPNIIGVDQSCGMLAVKLKKKKNLNDFAKLDKVIREYVPFGQNVRKEVFQIIPDELVENVSRITRDYLKEKPNNDLRKIGTLDGGNHNINW